ncbi:hypothetical protein PsAD2_01154 [Pseudovibrio axinellae]|uniref:Uncharacterized protein n=1 Tax=Pseudovibrio axinellae TaxID=989403 RepID=A0A166A6A8_9HYPH|nr:hypothetical protein PsAD2_01154 [Pseudovibrio axinellae]SER26299.1 hypothetical protein SAMN05421798_107223 [Pseudovibrio axinellae]
MLIAGPIGEVLSDCIRIKIGAAGIRLKRAVVGGFDGC